MTYTDAHAATYTNGDRSSERVRDLPQACKINNSKSNGEASTRRYLKLLGLKLLVYEA